MEFFINQNGALRMETWKNSLQLLNAMIEYSNTTPLLYGEVK